LLTRAKKEPDHFLLTLKESLRGGKE